MSGGRALPHAPGPGEAWPTCDECGVLMDVLALPVDASNQSEP
jgi:hypothetical protein